MLFDPQARAHWLIWMIVGCSAASIIALLVWTGLPGAASARAVRGETDDINEVSTERRRELVRLPRERESALAVTGRVAPSEHLRELPAHFTSCPPCDSTASRSRRWCALKMRCACSSPARCSSSVEATRSVNRIVTVCALDVIVGRFYIQGSHRAMDWKIPSPRREPHQTASLVGASSGRPTSGFAPPNFQQVVGPQGFEPWTDGLKSHRRFWCPSANPESTAR